MKKTGLIQALRQKTLKDNGFLIEDSWLVYCQEKSKSSPKRLANFIAWITRETVADDGKVKTRFFVIQGKMISGQDLKEIQVSENLFNQNLELCLRKHWGLDIIIRSGASNLLRESIQALSKSRKLTKLFMHTGWENIEGRWTFLHANGAIGNDSVEVNLSEGGNVLERYWLPQSCADPNAAAAAVFSLLDLAEPHVAYVLLAAVFYAPLTELLRPLSLHPDFMIFLTGRTQSGKSSLAARFLSFFGDFDKNSFPANYQNTPASLERTCFLLKDVVTVIDDYYPGQSHQEKTMFKNTAQKVARLYGDGAGRTKMRTCLTLQPSLPPGGLAISTGEERPAIGTSGQARMVFLDVDAKSVKYDLLTATECDKPLLSEFMMMYVTWIADNWEQVPILFEEAYLEAIAHFKSSELQGRINESVAKIFGALEIGMTFATEQGYISAEECADHGSLISQALMRLLKVNSAELEDEKLPSQKYLQAIKGLVDSGIYSINSVKVKSDKIPENHLGWYDDNYVYFLPDMTYRIVEGLLAESGESLYIGDKTLWRQLMRIPAYPDGESGNIRTAFRQHPDTCRAVSF